MIAIRHNTFETNSSSSHSLCINDTTHQRCTTEVVEDFRNDVWGKWLVVNLCEFSGTYDYWQQEERLAFLLQVVAFYNDISFYSNYEECTNKLYETEEFKYIEDEIKQYVDCDGILIRPRYAYISDFDDNNYSHDFYEYLSTECCCSVADFVFGRDVSVYISYNG